MGEQGVNSDGSLLRSVGEVVVSGGHVVEGSNGLELNKATIKVVRSSVQLLAVLGILISVGVSSLLELLKGSAASSLGGVVANGLVQLVKVGKTESNLLGEHGLGEPGPWVVTLTVVGLHLDNVGTIGSTSSLTGITFIVGVATSPLDVDKVSLADVEGGGDEVILNGGVGLDDVSTLSTDVQVDDLGTGTNNNGGAILIDDGGGTGLNVEGVGTVLEGTSELGGINGKSQVAWLTVGTNTIVDGGVSLNGGTGSVVRGINHGASSVNLSPRSVVQGGDVVTHAENAS